MGGYSRRERRNREAAARASASLPLLPEDASKDEDGLLKMPDGSLLPDGVYMCPDGNVIAYEGNYLSQHGGAR